MPHKLKIDLEDEASNGKTATALFRVLIQSLFAGDEFWSCNNAQKIIKENNNLLAACHGKIIIK